MLLRHNRRWEHVEEWLEVGMPLYEYQCTECGVRFERHQHFQDPPIHACPECGGPVQRLIGPVGVIFKGSGFYSTDHRSGGGRNNKNLPKAAAKGESKASRKDTAA